MARLVVVDSDVLAKHIDAVDFAVQREGLPVFCPKVQEELVLQGFRVKGARLTPFP